MKPSTILFCSALLLGPVTVSAQCPIMKSNINPITLMADGEVLSGGWTIMKGAEVDEYRTIAATVTFASDVDTLTVKLDEWSSVDLGIIDAEGDTARVRVTREAANPFESPEPRLRQIAPSGLLSREQAAFDIDALIYSLSEVHPDMFSVCRQADLMRAVNGAKLSLPDSVSTLGLYQRTAPIVAMLGDGHTHLCFPFNSVFTKELKRMPLFVRVHAGKMLSCTSSLDSIVPQGARIISINGRSAEEIIDSMLAYVSGEREHFRLRRIDEYFTALFQMLYASDTYTIRYQAEGGKATDEVTCPAMLWDDIVKRCRPWAKAGVRHVPYSFSLDSVNGVAVMDFRAFEDVNGMKVFADSMFRTLRDKEIKHLIIDVRHNGGGSSRVGDVLLRYISPEPFVQMDRTLVRITPLTAKLTRKSDIVRPRMAFREQSPEKYIKPLDDNQGHYRGKVYLLTSNYTFSSASSFAWTFKECSIGTVIGEETGGMNVSYGDILPYRLPISGLHCFISYKRFWQFRADEDDIHGTIPDVMVPSADALDTVMKMIKN